ncbi:MAG: hypothetical protein M0C28_17730 [Candidatus Moduliflexus flocculans]|nr:hypothetical protein [Candidatus Moduliflexus flocculans]
MGALLVLVIIGLLAALVGLHALPAHQAGRRGAPAPRSRTSPPRSTASTSTSAATPLPRKA